MYVMFLSAAILAIIAFRASFQVPSKYGPGCKALIATFYSVAGVVCTILCGLALDQILFGSIPV